MTKKATLKEVAAAANVTAQTVSRVLRQSEHVSPATRKKVLEVAEKLHYIPNRFAASLRTGNAKNIAVVFDSLKNFYFAIMIDYIQREVQERGYGLQTMFVNSHTMTESIYIDAISLGVSAVISFLQADDEISESIKRFGVPVMVFGRRTDIEEADYITTDDVRGGAMAAERFIERGCRNCAYLASGFGMTFVRDRYEGFSQALEKAGYEPRLINCDEGIRAALDGFVEKHGLPDGIFCMSDMTAFEAIKELKRYDGGQKTLVIGYDDISSDAVLPIDLTSVGIDKSAYVKHVITRLLEKAEKGSTARIAEKAEVRLHIGDTA